MKAKVPPGAPWAYCLKASTRDELWVLRGRAEAEVEGCAGELRMEDGCGESAGGASVILRMRFSETSQSVCAALRAPWILHCRNWRQLCIWIRKMTKVAML